MISSLTDADLVFGGRGHRRPAAVVAMTSASASGSRSIRATVSATSLGSARNSAAALLWRANGRGSPARAQQGCDPEGWPSVSGGEIVQLVEEPFPFGHSCIALIQQGHSSQLDVFVQKLDTASQGVGLHQRLVFVKGPGQVCWQPTGAEICDERRRMVLTPSHGVLCLIYRPPHVNSLIK